MIANIHPSKDMKGIRIMLPEDAIQWLDIDLEHKNQLTFADQLGSKFNIVTASDRLFSEGIEIKHFPAKTAVYLKLH